MKIIACFFYGINAPRPFTKRLFIRQGIKKILGEGEYIMRAQKTDSTKRSVYVERVKKIIIHLK